MRFICTNKNNLELFNRVIDWQALPATFQEAVILTYRLGLCYKRIDSLCICQDGTLDWRHEGSKMDSIYAGAYITLVASASSSPHNELIEREPIPSVVLGYIDDLSARSLLELTRKVNHKDLDPKDVPLVRRD